MFVKYLVWRQLTFFIFFQDSYDINDMDYHWDDENAVIILDDEMSEFELADAQSERKLVKYVIGMIQPFSSVSVLDLYYLREKKSRKK